MGFREQGNHGYGKAAVFALGTFSSSIVWTLRRVGGRGAFRRKVDLPTQSARTPHTYTARLPLPSPASLLGYFRQSRLALAQPDLLCWGRGRGSKGQSAPACAARCARARGHRCIGVRPSGGLELRTNVGGLSVSSRRSVVVCVTRSHQCTSNVWTPSVQNFAGVR